MPVLLALQTLLIATATLFAESVTGNKFISK